MFVSIGNILGCKVMLQAMRGVTMFLIESLLVVFFPWRL